VPFDGIAHDRNGVAHAFKSNGNSAVRLRNKRIAQAGRLD
jgi:hypothetical protein